MFLPETHHAAVWSRLTKMPCRCRKIAARMPRRTAIGKAVNKIMSRRGSLGAVPFRTTLQRDETMQSKLVPALAFSAFALLAAGQAHADGDAEAGKTLFKKCGFCHSTEAGKNKVGPSLAAIVGRKAGVEPGFNYSDALKSSGLTWDEATLNKWVENPKALVSGTKMIFPGIKDEKDRQNLIAYLKTLK
ncbi:Cytochrome c [Granulibacter bethesdensis]|nr:Cytochrome c [Granulibacter bethesdensis]